MFEFAECKEVSHGTFLEQNRVTAATVQRYTVALNEFLNFAKLPLNELQLVKNLDGMVV